MMLVSLLAPLSITAQGTDYDCVEFGPGESGSKATVTVCNGKTMVESSIVDFGACEGAANTCFGTYPN